MPNTIRINALPILPEDITRSTTTYATIGTPALSLFADWIPLSEIANFTALAPWRSAGIAATRTMARELVALSIPAAHVARRLTIVPTAGLRTATAIKTISLSVCAPETSTPRIVAAEGQKRTLVDAAFAVHAVLFAERADRETKKKRNRHDSRECCVNESSLLALRGDDARRGGFRCTNTQGDRFDCGGGPETCCGNNCKAPGDACCRNAEGYKFPCHGSCCGNACAAPGSKCCKVGNFTEWYPVSKETECRSPTPDGGVRRRRPGDVFWKDGKCINPDGVGHECGGGPETCCGWFCKAPNDKCCTNAVGDKFPCHGNCCGNACAAPGSKCCKVGNFTEWYPVSKETECRSPTRSDVGRYNGGSAQGAVEAVVGGWNHDIYQDDFNWTELGRVSKPDCSRVCRGDHNQCYPLKNNGYMGTPCGVLSQGNPQGCFFNSPTQTCALCDTNGQGYCCPTSHIRDCPRHL